MHPAPFIVGTGNCGTTLLRVMLNAHPKLSIPPETHFLPTVALACSSDHNSRCCLLDILSRSRNWSHFGIDIDQLRQRLAEIEPFDLSSGLRTFYALYAARSAKSRWDDKTPIYLKEMSTIEKLLPEARFVHLIRDGRDVAISEAERRAASGSRPRSIEKAAERWVSQIAHARNEAAALAYYIEVRYEDLVRVPEKTLRRVCRFIDLPWTPQILNYHARSITQLEADGQIQMFTDDITRRRWTRLGAPPDPARLERWRREMSESDQVRFQSAVGTFLTELGYEVSP